MKILVVSSGNAGNISPFVKQQSESIQKFGIEVEYFLIKGHGLLGYLSNLKALKNKLKQTKFDLVHAHFGLSGALAVLQRKVPVIATFHGCDLNKSMLRLISKYFVSPLAKSNIVVNESMLRHLPINKTTLVPCGIDLEQLPLIEKLEARAKLGFDPHKTYILFSSSFTTEVKNAPLAFEAMKLLNNPNVELIEFKGYAYDSIRYLFSAVDAALLTSFREGSPQFVKEAMVSNRPIISTDVGDVRWVMGNTEGCYICSYDPADVTEKIRSALNFTSTYGHTKARDRILELGLDSESIAKKVVMIYENALKAKS